MCIYRAHIVHCDRDSTFFVYRTGASQKKKNYTTSNLRLLRSSSAPPPPPPGTQPFLTLHGGPGCLVLPWLFFCVEEGLLPVAVGMARKLRIFLLLNFLSKSGGPQTAHRTQNRHPPTPLRFQYIYTPSSRTLVSP